MRCKECGVYDRETWICCPEHGETCHAMRCDQCGSINYKDCDLTNG